VQLLLINTFHFDNHQITLQWKEILWIIYFHISIELLYFLSIVLPYIHHQLSSHSLHMNVSSDN
jgi:hypothetical protein